MTKRLGLASLTAVAAGLLLPNAASAAGTGALSEQLNTTWVMVAAVLVLFMQAGFLLLEVGFSRQKNVGAGVAKILVNLGICTIAWWAVALVVASSRIHVRIHHASDIVAGAALGTVLGLIARRLWRLPPRT